SILRQRALYERASDLVESLFTTHVRRAHVIQSLRGNPLLGQALRQAALTLAEQYPVNPAALQSASWAVVRQPGASAEAYRHALLQAEEACELEPQREAPRLGGLRPGGMYLTLGMAQYRLGQYQAAVETLARSEKLDATFLNGSHPTNLAFLA